MKARWVGIVLLTGTCCAAPPSRRERFHQVRDWACAYGEEVPLDSLAGFGLLIVDPDGPPPLRRYRGLVLAYLSVGEVHESRAYFARVPIVCENEHWPGDFVVDLRDGRWRKMIVETLLPSLAGYDGIFLDTVDRAFDTDQVPAMVGLIREIRAATPGKILVANNPETMIEQIEVDGVMAEGIFTRYDFDAKTYGKADPAEAAARAVRYRGRRVLNLEYAVEPGLVDYALERSRAHGFLPYVTRIDLRVPTVYHRRPR